MKKLIILLLLFLPAVCFGATETFYVCHGGDGTLPETATCATAWDEADFNTAGNWNAGVDGNDTQIGANDTVIFMDEGGAFTDQDAEDAVLIIQGDGSSGKPITL